MKSRILAFLSDMDESLTADAGGEVMEVYHIGRSALLLQYGYGATTEDIDILRPQGSQRLVEKAQELFGKGTAKARSHGLYLELVDEALPPVPANYHKRATRVEGGWKVLQVYRLDPHDLAATKLRRFYPRDREDIRMLCDEGVLDEVKLEAVLEEAYRWTTDKDGDDYRDKTFKNLRTVQAYLRGEISEF